MPELEIKDIIGKKIDRYNNNIRIKDLQLNILLEITNAINSNLPTLRILENSNILLKNNSKSKN